MSAEAAFCIRSWTAGRYTCTLTMQRPKRGAVTNACISWLPEQPKKLTDSEIAEYRAGRDKALAEVSRELGINAAVIEIGARSPFAAASGPVSAPESAPLCHAVVASRPAHRALERPPTPSQSPTQENHMTTMSFSSVRPDLNDSLLEKGGNLGLHAALLSAHPAYLDPYHKDHLRVVGEVRDTYAAIYGDTPIPDGQGFETMTFATGTPTVATGESGDNPITRAGGYDVSFQT
jgi:hypothetical protein